MSKIRQLLRLYSHNISKKQISSQLDISRNTLKRYLRIYIGLRLTHEEIEKLSDASLDKLFGISQPRIEDARKVTLLAYFPDLEKKLRKRGATRRNLWMHDYLQRYPEGYGFTQFTTCYSKWLRVNKPVMHIEHKAGDKMYIDYAGEKLHIVNLATGELQAVEVFLSVLGGSQLTYIEATESQQKEDFIACCENALYYYGGVPQAIVPDNLKSAVTKSDKYEPTINEAFEQFASHYSTTILPARAYKPKDKSLVEGAVKIMYNRIYTRLEGQVFCSLEELNIALAKLLEEEYNAINFTNRDYSRRSLFEEIERQQLQPLPKKRFTLNRQRVATVAKHGHVCLTEDKHYYSVPYHYIGKRVVIYYTKKDVSVFHNHLCIATHQRLKSMYGYTTQADHLASQHKYMTDWTPDKFIADAALIDPVVERLVEHVLHRRQHPEQSYRICNGILHLEKKVGKERLVRACQLALDYQQYNYAMVKRILERGLDKIHHEQEIPIDTPLVIPMHTNIRGETYYK